MAATVGKANIEQMDTRVRHVTVRMLRGYFGGIAGEVYLHSLFFPCSALDHSKQCYENSLVLCLSNRPSQWETLAGDWRVAERRIQFISPLLFLSPLISPAVAASPLCSQLLSQLLTLCSLL